MTPESRSESTSASPEPHHGPGRHDPDHAAPDPRAALPSVSAVLDDLHDTDDVRAMRADLLAGVARQVLDELRRVLATADGDPTPARVRADAVAAVRARAADLLVPPTRAVNATGVVLHTGLGRAALSPTARDAVAAATGAHAVELDEDGRRGHRDARLADLVTLLTGAEDATFANNGAGALVLALRAVAGGGRVAVSRGELIEIGGSFRLPDVIAAAGVDLHELGTTNRTHLADVEAALDDGVDAVLVVHPSNYRVQGFASRPARAEVAAACHRAGVPLVHDAGSGLVEDVDTASTAGEPSLRRALADGADLVTGSGDKLLGGPQAGLVVGRADLVAAARRDPLARALRLDKLRVAGLVATLQDHLRDPSALPVRRALDVDVGRLHERATRIVGDLDALGVPAEVVEVPAVVGGGSVPGRELASVAVALEPAWAERLRAGRPPVLGRVRGGHCLLDLRAVPIEDDPTVVDAVRRVVDDSRT